MGYGQETADHRNRVLKEWAEQAQRRVLLERIDEIHAEAQNIRTQVEVIASLLDMVVNHLNLGDDSESE